MTCVDCDGYWKVALPPTPDSASNARAFLRKILSDKCSEDQLDNAQLCLSELVTNALLHARSDMEMSISISGESVRLAVSDLASDLPIPAATPGAGTTGRGLGLVSVLAHRWGVERHDNGKSVWCVLGLTADAVPQPTPELQPLPDRLDIDDSDTNPTVGEILLLGYPVALGVRNREHFDAVRRECQLLQLDPQHDEHDLPKKLLAISEVEAKNLTKGFGKAEIRKVRSRTSGARTVDLSYPVIPETIESLYRWREVLDELDEFCARRELLSSAPAPALVELRTWFFGEFDRQLQGGEARPWSGPVD